MSDLSVSCPTSAFVSPACVWTPPLFLPASAFSAVVSPSHRPTTFVTNADQQSAEEGGSSADASSDEEDDEKVMQHRGALDLPTGKCG